MKARFFILLSVLAVGLGVLSSCSDAIYQTIETEKKVTTNTLPLLMSIFDIETTAPGVPGGPYSVAGGAVFQGTLSGPSGTVQWNPNINTTARPYNPPGTPLCNAMALFGTTLWGGFITSSGAASLYQSDGTFSFAAGHGTQISMPTPGEQITLLQSAGTFLFVGGATPTATGYSFQLDTFDGATWTAQVRSGLTKPITGVGFDGGKYWVASGSTLSTSITATGSYVDATPAIIAGDTINGLFADNAVVIVMTKTRGVFYTQDGGATWIRINAEVPDGSANPASYLCAAGPIDTVLPGPGDLYLVGSDGNNTTGFGYYTLSLSGHSMKRFSDSTILLYTSSVSHILVDGENVLMGTNFNGLWRAVFNKTNGQVLNGTNQYWIHE